MSARSDLISLISTNGVLVCAPHWWWLGTGQAPVNVGNIPSPVPGQTLAMTNMAAGYGLNPQGWLRYDATDDHIQSNYDPTHTDASQLTIEVWAWCPSAGQRGLVSSQQDPNEYWETYVNAQKLYLAFRHLGTLRRFISTDTITLNAMHQMVFQKNGGTLQGWIDGAPIAAYDTQDTYNLGTYNLTENGRIGCRGTAAAIQNVWDGYIAWVGVFNTALSSAQILAHYNMGWQMGGVWMNASGVLTDPAVTRPGLPVGSTAYGNCRYMAPIIYRPEGVI